jgi:S1-C subfamily serine protease
LYTLVKNTVKEGIIMTTKMIITLMCFCFTALVVGCTYDYAIKKHNASVSAIFTRVASSSVLIETDSGMGSGTIVSVSNGRILVLTCYHVISDAKQIEVVSASTSAIASVISVNVKKDLAVLMVSQDLRAPALKVAFFEPELYEKLYTVANPLSIIKVASEGILYSKKESRPGVDLWGVQSFLFPGSSGGTITNAQGELVCVPQSIVATKQFGLVAQLDFCVGLKDIRDILRPFKLIVGR